VIDPERCEALVDLALVEGARGHAPAGRVLLQRALAACGARLGFVRLHEAALHAASGDAGAALRTLEEAVRVLAGDDLDKRREALADLLAEPLYAPLRGEPRFRALVERLRSSVADAPPA
jgi:hypothetical protein